MKHLVTLALTLLPSMAFCQSPHSLRSGSSHIAVLSTLLAPQGNDALAMKTTAATLQRVIAQSTRDNTLASLSDSLNLSYTGLNYSRYDYNMMLYPYNYAYSTSPMFNYLGTFAKPQVLFDECKHWTINPFTLLYGYYETTYGTYDANKNQLTFKHTYTDSVTNKNMSFMNTFSTANNIVKGCWFNWNAGVADSAFKQFFTYNAANKLTQDSTYELHLGTWRIVSKTNYTYDASNNLITINNFANTTDTSLTLPLIEQQRYENTYDASNRLATVLTSMYNGTSLIPYVKDTFDYTGTGTFHTSWRQHQWDLINAYWAPMIKTEKHLNASNLPDTVNIFGFDSLANAWTPAARHVVSYNSMSNPEVLQEYLYAWTAFPSTPDYTTTYYYETYQDPTDVMAPVPEWPNVWIYPNPASDHVTIAGLNEFEGKQITITLSDLIGRLVMRQDLTAHHYTSLYLAQLAAARYNVVIYDREGHILHRSAIVKTNGR